MPRHRTKRRRHRRGGGPETDDLEAVERGEKYGPGITIPQTFSPSSINLYGDLTPQKPVNAVDFFEKASEGLGEQAKLEEKYRMDKEREASAALVRESMNTPASASEYFSKARPEIENQVREYTEAEMEPFNFSGGRRKRRQTRKRRRTRRRRNSHRKSRK